ncbi:MAG: ATP-binding cassette domain-containing protein [Phycisphaerales bacterium]|nr:ATP-binding cassette domain-containing protein [Phycisphaerales bacterium]
MTLDILQLGIRDGLVWLPIILGFGLLFVRMNEVDVSLDGVVVLSGIVTAMVANATGSPFASIILGSVSGAVLSGFVATLTACLRVPQLMCGVVFSLAAHSISVKLIGESVRIPDTGIIAGAASPPWLWLLSLVILALTTFAYRTHFGILVRKRGDGVLVNNPILGPNVLYMMAYVFSGSLYGLGGAIYVHKLGTARSGGGFEFLVVALSAFLCVRRATEAIRNIVAGREIPVVGSSGSAATPRMASFFTTPEASAVLGALFYGTLVHVVLATSPDPSSWKIVLATLLVLSLLDYANVVKLMRRLLTPFRKPVGANLLNIHNVCFSYADGPVHRVVFDGASAEFTKGLTLLVGSNGVGKSTLLKLISGQIQNYTGSFALNHESLDRIPSHRRPIFLVTQNPFLTIGHSLMVRDFMITALLFNQNRHECDVITALRRQLQQLGFGPDYFEDASLNPYSHLFWRQRVSDLSGGQATVVALLGSMITDTSLLLLDEPTTGVDQKHGAVIVALLKAVARDRIVIVTTHDMRLVASADAILRIHNGKLELIKSLSEQLTSPKSLAGMESGNTGILNGN